MGKIMSFNTHSMIVDTKLKYMTMHDGVDKNISIYSVVLWPTYRSKTVNNNHQISDCSLINLMIGILKDIILPMVKVNTKLISSCRRQQAFVVGLIQ
jgi:hypothetical protein